MPADLSGFKRLALRRYAQGTLSAFDLEAIATKAAAAQMAGEATVEITASGFDGANSTGVLVMSTNELLVAVMDVLESIAPVVAPVAPRRCFVRADFSQPDIPLYQ